MSTRIKKEGNNRRFKRFYGKNHAKRREYIKNWSKGKSTGYLHAHRAKHPEKYKARVAVSNALRLGKIVRPTLCSACSVECKPTAHHADYSKPLDVTWLCMTCHLKTHGKKRHGEAA